MTTVPEKEIRQAFTILDEIEALTERGILYLQQNEIISFANLVEKREELFGQLRQIRGDLNNGNSADFNPAQIAEINEKIRNKIQNITKVDRKAFDIINRVKMDLQEHMDQTKRGEKFLKSYKNRINSQRTVQRTI